LVMSLSTAERLPISLVAASNPSPTLDRLTIP
jgi:hypothetical protein